MQWAVYYFVLYDPTTTSKFIIYVEHSPQIKLTKQKNIKKTKTNQQMKNKIIRKTAMPTGRVNEMQDIMDKKYKLDKTFL